jgi:hypothetical protein
VVLRTTSQSRIYNSLINWAIGFLGESFQSVPNPNFPNVTSPFEVTVILEDNDDVIGYLGDSDLFVYIPKYLCLRNCIHRYFRFL